MTQVTTFALMGAGGKMGCRITDNLLDDSSYQVLYVEVSEAGKSRLAERGAKATAQDEALAQANMVVLALPDNRIGAVSGSVVPTLNPGTLLITLDPAAAHAGKIPLRDDLAYFVTHPCHPPVFHDEVSEAAQNDWFGGVHAKHHIVCALHHGNEADYAKGEALARAIFAPVMDSYRVTVEQMAILEPAMAETCVATLVTAMKEALEETVKLGVPREAAKAFMMGHIRVPLAIVFGYADFPFSDGAQFAIDQAYAKIFKPDWKENIFNREAVKQSVEDITSA